jgi:hypothetical protein
LRHPLVCILRELVASVAKDRAAAKDAEHAGRSPRALWRCGAVISAPARRVRRAR